MSTAPELRPLPDGVLVGRCGAVFVPHPSGGLRRARARDGQVRLGGRRHRVRDLVRAAFVQRQHAPAVRSDELRPLPQAPHYLIGDAGEVFSRFGGGTVCDRYRQLRPHRRHDGYAVLWVCIGDGTRRRDYLHRVVAAAFDRPPEPGEVVRHLDGSRGRNDAGNLAVGTPDDNARDTARHGRASKRLTADAVLDMRRRSHRGESDRSLSMRFGVCQKTVSDVTRGRTWLHVGGPVRRAA